MVLALFLGARSGAQPTQAARPGDVAESAKRAASGRMEPGDRVVVHIVGEPLLTDTAMVTQRGEAAFAKIGMMSVAQFTIEQLQDTLTKQLSRYYRTPALEILVLRRVSVNGEVTRPGVYLVDISTTLRDVVAQAGGITEYGNRKEVYIVRGSDRTRVPDWDTSSGLASDLRSGDQVMVGRKPWIVINALSVVSTVVVVTSLLVTLFK